MPVQEPKAQMPKQLIGVRVTPEQHRVLAAAAKREHRSLNSFVVQAALRAAEQTSAEPVRKSPEDIMAIFRSVRERNGSRSPDQPDLLETFLAERRRAAASE